MPTSISSILKGHRIDSRILICFLILAITTLAFLKLASEVMERDTAVFDRAILEALRNRSDPSVPVGPAWLQAAMIDITAMGGVAVLTLITALVAGYLLIVRKFTTAVFLTAAVAGGAITSTVLKFDFARPRPELVAHLVKVHTTSFPSGHALNSAVTYLTLGALLARAEQDRRARIFFMGAAIFLTLTIGFSRVYLGVHWPSDVIAGWCVGAAWAVLCSLVARALQRRNKIDRPEMGLGANGNVRGR
jgi:undecaprenyl-diphosphatase